MQITRLHTTSESSETKTTRPLNRRIKTIQSIMSQTQSSESHLRNSLLSKQQVFLNNPFIFTQQNEDRHAQMTFLHESLPSNEQMIQTNRAEQTECQTDQISRMKLMFESRLNSQKNNRNYQPHKSIDRSPHSKSIEKHTLKPTNIPNFNKLFQKTKPQKFQQQNQSIESPNFSHQNKQKQSLMNQMNNFNRSQIMKSSSNQNQTVKITNLIEKSQSQALTSLQKRNLLDCSGISSKFGQYEFGSQTKGMSLSDQCKISQQKIQIPTYGNILNFNSIKNEHHIPQNSSQHKNYHCNCQSLLITFMQQTNNKMAQITERLMILQNQNARLKKIEESFMQNKKIIQNYQQQAQLMQRQCNQLKQSNYSYQAQKQEMQLLLKQILFKREKQKYHQTSTSSSKQNTHRYQYDSKSRLRIGNQISDLQGMKDDHQFEDEQISYDRKIGNSHKKDPTFIVKKGIEPLGVKTTNINYSQKQPKSDKKSQTLSDSKVKMQNLLSKIQIKIQKS